MSRKYFDIKRPEQKDPTPRMVRVPVGIPYLPINSPVPPKTKHFSIPATVVVAVFLLLIGLFSIDLFHFRKSAVNSQPLIYRNFQEGASALFNFDLETAKESFQAAAARLKELKEQAPLKTAPAILADLFKVSQSAASLSGNLEKLKTEGLAMVVKNKGASLLAIVQSIKEEVAEIKTLVGGLKEQAARFGYELGEEFDAFRAQLDKNEHSLAAFASWLEAPRKQRILIFFQNPSEIRPAGGFIGSYAQAVLFQGGLLSLEVRDIYDPDGQLDKKIIPPKQLRGVTDKWGARDANWFFDFPTSARKVTEFLEASKLYSDYGVKFAGAVAVNIAVIKDILGIIGPMELPDYEITITSENFLTEVQQEVEEGTDKAQGEPKRILRVLAPLVFERLEKLDDEQKRALAAKLGERVAGKDIMAYSAEPALQEYLIKLGVGGEVYSLPENFRGEYLAIANANVAGGKSDAFMSQKIEFVGKINREGVSQNRVVIKRSHNGENEKDWWYRATNKNYVQLLATPGAALKGVAGATAKVVRPLVADYEKEGFEVDEDLAEMEAKGTPVFGKILFGRWLEVKAGGTGKLVFDYVTPKQRPEIAGSYQFVFDKQSGVDGQLAVTLKAPPGYQWQESQSDTFEYSSDDLPARVILNLNLIEK